MQRKIRTREHVIASQSVAHVERHVAAAGYSVEKFVNDYGYDLNLHTYGPDGEAENGNIYLQLKATNSLKVLRNGEAVSFAVDQKDVAFWRDEVMPVILIVYDAPSDTAYWLYLQELFETNPKFQLPVSQKKITLHLSRSNIVDAQSIKQFRHFKLIVLDQMRGKVKHHG